MAWGKAIRVLRKLSRIVEVSERISAFEQAVVTSESYVRKTSLLDMAERPPTGAMSPEAQGLSLRGR